MSCAFEGFSTSILKRSLRSKPWLALFALACLSGCDGVDLPLKAAPPERIVLIVVDALRQDHVSAYGGSNQTPNMDALAERGQLFPNAVSSYHQTTMSMAALFTGLTPSLEVSDPKTPMFFNERTQCGMRRFATDPNDEACIPASVKTLAESLHSAGYFTLGVVTNGLLFGQSGFERGFDEWVEVGLPERFKGRKGSELLGNRNQFARGYGDVLSELESQLDSRSTDHFFLYVHFMDVHDFVLFQRGNYAKAVSLADRGVGRVMNTLEERGLLDGSVVFLLSDHGERRGEKHFTRGLPFHLGNPSFEEHLRIPLIVAPAIVEDSNRMIRTDDVHRLILGLAEVSEVPTADLAPDEFFASELTFQIYRRGRWKSFYSRESGEQALIDLEDDPGEKHDVAAEHPEIVAEHRARMDELTDRLKSTHLAHVRLPEATEPRPPTTGSSE